MKGAPRGASDPLRVSASMTDAVIVPSMQKAPLKRKPWAPPRQCDTGEAARRGGRLCPPAEYSAFFGNLRRIRNILRADKSRRPLQKTEVPRSAAPCSIEAVSDESPADSLDCADTGADPSGDQYGCKKLHSDASLYSLRLSRSIICGTASGSCASTAQAALRASSSLSPSVCCIRPRRSEQQAA